MDMVVVGSDVGWLLLQRLKEESYTDCLTALRARSWQAQGKRLNPAVPGASEWGSVCCLYPRDPPMGRTFPGVLNSLHAICTMLWLVT